MKGAIVQNYGVYQTQEIKKRYQESARNYDKFIKTYSCLWRIFGFRYEQWREKTIEELHLKEGQTVIDLGCGTGLNFSHLEKKLGPSGHIYGVDISQAMLAQASKKITKNKSKNLVFRSLTNP